MDEHGGSLVLCPHPALRTTGDLFTCSSVKALIRHIKQFIEHWNINGKPFVWTKSAEQIVAKVVR